MGTPHCEEVFGCSVCGFPLPRDELGQKPREAELPHGPGCFPWFLSRLFPLVTAITTRAGRGGSSSASGLGSAESPAGTAPAFPFPTVSPTACTPKSTQGKAENLRNSPWGNAAREDEEKQESCTEGNHRIRECLQLEGIHKDHPGQALLPQDELNSLKLCHCTAPEGSGRKEFVGDGSHSRK